MTRLWSGSAPANLAPQVEPLRIDRSAEMDPGTTLKAEVAASDPEGGELTARWALMPEANEFLTGGDFRPTPAEVDGVVVESGVASATIRMPDNPGAYRLYYYVYDEAGKAATANKSLLVKGTPRTNLPLAVYSDGFETGPWAPSGWMGNIDALSVDGDHSVNPKTGNHCIRVSYEGVGNWAGVAWQDPPGDWGDKEGGYNLEGATALEFWARGENGGETINFGVGLLEEDKEYPDSAIEHSENVPLTKEWTLYRIPLEGADLSSIKTGFFFSLEGSRSPVTFYLDDIRFVD